MSSSPFPSTKYGPEVLLGGICTFGIYLAFRTSAPDLHVFTYAGKLVAEGGFARIYADSPDRFLYAPGAALLFAPLAALPFPAALAVWCLFKVIGWYSLLPRLRVRFSDLVLLASIAVISRPLLIDFRYGNVNALLLILAMHFVLSLQSSTAAAPARPGPLATLGELFFGAFAFLKLLFLPVGVLAFRGLRVRTIATFGIGVLTVILLPFTITHSFTGFTEAYVGWLGALRDKGLPTETHNQSLLGFLFRILGGVPSRSLYLGGRSLELSIASFSASTLYGIFRAYFALWVGTLGTLLYKYFRSPNDSRRGLDYGFLFLSLVWIGSHILWKPYFVFGFPVVLLAMERLVRERRWTSIAMLIGLTLIPGLDSLGPHGATVYEALSPMLWLHFTWVGIAVWEMRNGKGADAISA